MGTIDIQEQPLTQENKKLSDISHFKELSSGAGSTILKQDKNGLFVGGTNYENAPWAVDYQGKQYIGANGEILFDGPNKKIVVTTGGLIQSDFIKDSTYGLNGVFCYTTTNTKTSSNWTHTTTVPSSGGLLNVSLNYLDASGYYKLLPGYNTATAKPYYYVFKDAGFYKIYYYAGNIYADVAHTNLYFTMLFNSQEANGW
jgi:hypothetical protein